MNDLLKYIGAVIVSATISIGIFSLLPKREVVNNLGSLTGGENRFNSVASSSAMAITTSSARITATSSTRQYIAIVNDGSNVVYLKLSDSPAVINSGIRLNASGGSYEINSENMYTGSITAIADGGTSIITFTEK